MELQDFIKETLTDIAFGIHEAKVEAKDLVAICSGSVNTNKNSGDQFQEKTEIEFDIALTVQETKSKEGSISAKIEPVIKVLSASIGMGLLGGVLNWGKSRMDEKIHRIHFKVPVILNAHYRDDKGFPAEAETIRLAAVEREKKKHVK